MRQVWCATCILSQMQTERDPVVITHCGSPQLKARKFLPISNPVQINEPELVWLFSGRISRCRSRSHPSSMKERTLCPDTFFPEGLQLLQQCKKQRNWNWAPCILRCPPLLHCFRYSCAVFCLHKGVTRNGAIFHPPLPQEKQGLAEVDKGRGRNKPRFASLSKFPVLIR